MSFFDDGEETAVEPSTRAQRSQASGRSGARRGPQPRRPQRARAPLGADQRTLLIRRATAGAVVLVILILIVLLISSLLKSAKQEELKTYNRDVSALASESVEKVSHPLFAALASAPSKKALEIDVQVNQLGREAREELSRAQHLSVPGGMEGAQQNFLLVAGLRVEGMEKLASLLQTVLGSKTKRSLSEMAGAMEILLASDTIYSQRVAPLIQQTLSSNGINSASTASSRFMPNLGWLETSTLSTRLTGTSSSSSTPTTGGTHGSALIGVSVAGNTLAGEPTLNHLSGGSSPKFTVAVEDSGESIQTNVKVDVKVTAGGKEHTASRTIEKLEPGKTSDAEISLSAIPTGAAAKVEVEVEKVPGETNLENNKGSFLAIFE